MLLLNSYILVLPWTLTTAQWLEPRTAEGEYSRTLQQRSNLPNPYQMPDSPYSIHFQQPGPYFESGPEVQKFIDYVLEVITAHIRTWGDDILPRQTGNVHGLRVRAHPYQFSVLGPEGALTYNDTTHILAAFVLKSKLEGYRERPGDLFETATGDPKGIVLLAKSGFGVESRNKTLQIGPIPNPYVLPDSDLSVDFDEPLSDLVPNDVFNCIVSARRRVTRQISERGEGPITIPTIWFTWKSVEFRIFAEQVQRRVTLNDTLDILNAFAIKSGLEGFRSRWGSIMVTHGGQIIGQVLLGHSHPVAGEAGNHTTSLESYRRARRSILT